MERPNRCFIRQEWFEAVSFLPPEDRCAFYETLLSFVYYGKPRDPMSPAVRGMFEMCKQTLQKDCQSYTQKVLANRQNGSAGGRPRADITQENPPKPTQTQAGTTYTITKLIQNNLCTSGISERKRDVLILIELFACGCSLPTHEAAKMIDYYNARGWVDKGGNPIVDVCALARVWKPENKSTYFANVRKKWATFLRSIGDNMPDILVSDFSRMERKTIDNKSAAVIYCTSEAFIDELETNHLDALKLALKTWGVETIHYKIESPLNAKENTLQPYNAV